LITLIVSLIVLGVLVTVHEGGHFIAARLCGITVEKFSVGFGKPIFKFVKGGVEYSLSWIPLGGYVKMKGDSADSECTDADSFLNAAWWKRVIVAFAGPFTNLLFALLILVVSFMFPQKVTDHFPVVDYAKSNLATYFQAGDFIKELNGSKVEGWYEMLGNLKNSDSNTFSIERAGNVSEVTIPALELDNWLSGELIRPVIPAQVGEIIPKSPAYLSGIKEGDIITSVSGEKVNNWYEMTAKIATGSDDITITLLRDEEELTKKLHKMELPDSDRKLIGITQALPIQYDYKLGFSEAIVTGTTYTLALVKMNYVGIINLIKKPSTLKGSIGGPVMIFSTSKQYAKKGIAKTLQFIGLMNIILMVMNLLPIPVLDGGHILFSTIEGIRGKKMTMKTQIMLQQVGMFLLLSLMIYAFYSDFHGIISRYRAN